MSRFTLASSVTIGQVVAEVETTGVLPTLGSLSLPQLTARSHCVRGRPEQVLQSLLTTKR